MAQGRISVGAELALPQGDWNDFIATGFGATVRYEAPINDNISWMGTAGFLAFGEKDDSGAKATVIPVNAGAKYYFNGESFTGFYGGAELGLNFATVKVESEVPVGFDPDTFEPIYDSREVKDSETKFGFAPQIGYHLPSIDISLRYAIIEDMNYLGFRVAYVLGN